MKKILLIFPDPWFSYSPTAINILRLLSEKNDIQVVALEIELDGKPVCIRYENERINYVKFPHIPKFLGRILSKMESIYNNSIGKYFKKISVHKIIQAIVLFKACRKIKANEVIAIDAVGFYVAHKLFKKVHFVSLEISKDDIFYHNLVRNVSKIDTILIQNEERLRLLNLALNNKQKIFIVQNAPIYNNIIRKPSFNSKIVYFGSGNLTMGVRYLFEYFTQYKSYSLMFKGLFDVNFLNINFPYIASQSNIEFDDSYTSNDDIQNYLIDYSIGLCFYDFDYVSESYRQNRLHGPAGKIFNYFAAGLPVIGSDIPGFQIIKEYGTGILLVEPTPENIHKAIEQIKSNYRWYSENSIRAAKDFCFKKAFLPYMEYLDQKHIE